MIIIMQINKFSLLGENLKEKQQKEQLKCFSGVMSHLVFFLT